VAHDDLGRPPAPRDRPVATSSAVRQAGVAGI
jgi:hypothetical protein